MIRVLHIMGCSDAGGISTVVLNYYRHIDRTRIHFDIGLTIPTVGQNGRLLQELGCRIHFLPLKSEGLAVYRKALAELLEKERYDAVHVHDSETCYVSLQVAEKAGVRCRLAHCHTTSPWEGIKGEIRRLSGCVLNYHYATHVIGCGQLAGERVFGKWNMRRPKAMVLPNAVETERFAFNEQIRREVRQELGLEGKYVLGMVGRLDAQKNYPFAFELMANLRHQLPNVILVAAGNGPDEDMLRGMIEKMGLQDCVCMLGRRSDVNRLYQAFDLFLMPSLYEGFPVAGVEALCSGLPVLLSDQITGELKFGSCVRYLSLKDQKCWIREILQCRDNSDASGRVIRQKEPGDNGLDIRDAARILDRVDLEDTSGKRDGDEKNG